MLFLLKKGIKYKELGENFVKKKAQKQKLKRTVKKGTKQKIDENKKSIIIISDRAKPFIKHFSFIKGFTGGKLNYESTITGCRAAVRRFDYPKSGAHLGGFGPEKRIFLVFRAFRVLKSRLECILESFGCVLSR